VSEAVPLSVCALWRGQGELSVSIARIYVESYGTSDVNTSGVQLI